MKARWQTVSDTAEMAQTACRLIGVTADDAIRERGRFRLVLAGGSTPLETYRRLAGSEQQWQHWSLYYGDERCLPADDPGRDHFAVTQDRCTRLQRGGRTAQARRSAALHA